LSRAEDIEDDEDVIKMVVEMSRCIYFQYNEELAQNFCEKWLKEIAHSILNVIHLKIAMKNIMEVKKK